MTRSFILYNGNVLTQSSTARVNSLAVKNGIIIAVGNNLQNDQDFKNYKKIDLKGATVTPGFVDAHAHFYYMALSLGRVNLQDLKSYNDYLLEIKSFANKIKKDQWVVGEGYSQEVLGENISPNRYDLDKVTNNRPAFIFSKDQHTAWVNSKALKLAGISKRSKNVEGGIIERDEDGEPTGLLKELPAIKLVFQKIKSSPEVEIRKLYSKALQIAYQKGVTGVHSFDGHDGYLFFKNLANSNKIGLRIHYYIQAADMNRFSKIQIQSQNKNSLLNIAGVKIFSDGSLGSQTALCFNKYIGSKENYGVEVTSIDKMTRIIRRANKLGLPVAVHAIGDKAVSNVLDAFEHVYIGESMLRHRIEHLQLIRRKDIKRLKKLNVTASMQPSHCPTDINIIRKFWGKQGRNAFIFKTLSDLKIPMAFGSDAPIEPLDPLAGIEAVVRRSKQGKNDLFYPEQRLSVDAALHNFTLGPAVATGMSDQLGKILPGYIADLTILNSDITRVPKKSIHKTKVVATIIDGEFVYSDSSLKF